MYVYIYIYIQTYVTIKLQRNCYNFFHLFYIIALYINSSNPLSTLFTIQYKQYIYIYITLNLISQISKTTLSRKP